MPGIPSHRVPGNERESPIVVSPFRIETTSGPDELRQSTRRLESRAVALGEGLEPPDDVEVLHYRLRGGSLRSGRAADLADHETGQKKSTEQ